MILERIASPRDLKALPRADIDPLASEIREQLVEACSKNGGHLGPNLGVVELSLALHKVLDAPKDKIVWDVSHQIYVHKMLTGRADRIMTIRKGGGLSGFAMRSESEYDAFGAGHASTSISAALGMAQARDLAGTDETVVAIIGDGALTGGLAYEAINNAGQLKTNFIVILNDNEMSIAPNVGAMDKYLGTLRSKPLFNAAREKVKDILGRVPFGDTARKALSTAEEAGMRMVTSEPKTAVIFEEMGFRYIGPIDGHDYDTLVEVISNARKIQGPVLLHVRTVKGKGFEPAELDKRTFPRRRSLRTRERQDRVQVERAAHVLRGVRRRTHDARRPRSPHHRDYCGDAGRHPAQALREEASRQVLRCGHRGSARRVLRGRCRDVGSQARRRDLLDVHAARVRSGRHTIS